MAKTQNQWKWYHYAVSIFGWIFLIVVHFVWVVGPWYLVVSEYLELKNGIDVVADYQTSSAIYSDTKLDHEKEYLYIYRFSHPTTGERIEHSFRGVGKDKHPGEEIHLKFNPETGSVGFGSLVPILFSKFKYLIASLFGLVWVIKVMPWRYLVDGLKSKKEFNSKKTGSQGEKKRR